MSRYSPHVRRLGPIHLGLMEDEPRGWWQRTGRAYELGLIIDEAVDFLGIDTYLDDDLETVVIGRIEVREVRVREHRHDEDCDPIGGVEDFDGCLCSWHGPDGGEPYTYIAKDHDHADDTVAAYLIEWLEP